MLSGDIAARIGRPGLARGGNGAARTAGVAARANVATPWASAGAGADVTLGQITAGTAGMLVVGLVLFYLWTREHQL